MPEACTELETKSRVDKCLQHGHLHPIVPKTLQTSLLQPFFLKEKENTKDFKNEA